MPDAEDRDNAHRDADDAYPVAVPGGEKVASPSGVLRCGKGQWTRANLFSWLRIFALVLCIKGCLLDIYTIPSGSMDPTLQGDGTYRTDDRVLVNKAAYGPRIPFTNIRLWNWAAPKRWDIVVFSSVEDTSEHNILVKRIVGLPGETVELVEGQLEVNGDPVPFPDGMPEEMWYASDQEIQRLIRMARTAEERNRLLSIRAQYPYRYGNPEMPENTLIPEGHYWVLGDSTMNSVDGRIWGWVPNANIHGRVFAIGWPWGHRRDFSGFSTTWWGILLLYGLPLLLFAIEIRRFWWGRKHDREATSDSNENCSP